MLSHFPAESSAPGADPARDALRPASTRLGGDDSAVAALALDLDSHLHFRTRTLLLTRQKFTLDGQDWLLAPGMQLRLSDHAGVGTLELLDTNGRIAIWRFTLGAQNRAAHMVEQFQRVIAQLDRSPELAWDEPARTCPQCQAELPADSDECPECAPEAQQAPPSTWVLLRLWRFARPYRWTLLTGFALTLASTAATLVPPYLTIPLMDRVLIPFQNGQEIDIGLVLALLGGLLGSALLAWGLGWARTWLLALVSERISSDLRTTTFDHLLELSLDYFGSKRTGDLMARIGSETDRISVFLSLHALDFVTDLLMIGMTAVILFSINPWLALVTLLPLPFIAWMIHLVRDRLRTGFEKIDRVWGEVTNVLADTIPGIRVVKAFAQEGREAKRFRRANEHNLTVNDRINKTWSLFTPTVTLLTEIGLLVVWAFGIWLVSRSEITVGVLTAFIAYIGRFYGRLD